MDPRAAAGGRRSKVKFSGCGLEGEDKRGLPIESEREPGRQGTKTK